MDHSIGYAKYLPNGRIPKIVVLFSVREEGCNFSPFCGSKRTIMVKSLFWKRTSLPTFHPRSCHCYPIDTASRIADVTTDFFETPAPEQLTPSGNMILAFKAVFGRVIPILYEGRSSYS